MADGNTPMGNDEAGPTKNARRSDRQVRGAARMLQKEARRILRRYASRIAADPADDMRACIAAIDTHRAANNVEQLEVEAEKLDELLHRHANFARKSALRETLENIGIAVIIALGLRSCFYEPFKIPSGSMMPTLRKGDHIFVNKFTYGIQIPFTSTVVGESLGHIERGDVVVFRYPLNPKEDFIKRVIGLPGDEVKVVGRRVSIKREGQDTFEILERSPLDEPCLDEDGDEFIGPCQLFEETLDDHTYVVRYMSMDDPRDLSPPRSQVWTVPPRHLLVMGDNRNQSHDSLAWTITVEAVQADGILRDKDLRDITSKTAFTLKRGDGEHGITLDASNPLHDKITYVSSHRSPQHDLRLAVWRNPVIPAQAVFDAMVVRVPLGKPSSVDTLLEGSSRSAAVDRAGQIGASIDALVIGETKTTRHALAYLGPAQAVLHLECGNRLCDSDEELALALSDIIGRFEKDHGQDARDLLKRPKGIRFGAHWTGRADVRDHFHEVLLRPEGEESPRASIRLRAFRKPKDSVDVLQEAALRAVESSPAEATVAAGLGDRAWIVERDEQFTIVAVDASRKMMFVLDCGRDHCPDAKAATALASTIWARVPKAAADRRNLRKLLVPSDVGDLPLAAVPRPSDDAYDRVGLEATVDGEGHSVEVEVWRTPAEGLPATVAAVRAEYDLQPDDSIAAGGSSLVDEQSYHYVFAVPASKSVVRVRCFKGLCDEEQAKQLARRAAQSAQDPSNFVDEEAERPKPFVPRGNVKGRAERIWWPSSRFWLPIR